jgi:hypothetical protein
MEKLSYSIALPGGQWDSAEHGTQMALIKLALYHLTELHQRMSQP